jgi:hypothetical protein
MIAYFQRPDDSQLLRITSPSTSRWTIQCKYAKGPNLLVISWQT